MKSVYKMLRIAPLDRDGTFEMRSVPRHHSRYNAPIKARAPDDDPVDRMST